MMAAARRSDGARDPGMLNVFAFFQAELLHDAGNAVRAELAHQVVFQRKKESRTARIALASGAASQLAVDPPRVMAFGADNLQPAGPVLFILIALP